MDLSNKGYRIHGFCGRARTSSQGGSRGNIANEALTFDFQGAFLTYAINFRTLIMFNIHTPHCNSTNTTANQKKHGMSSLKIVLVRF